MDQLLLCLPDALVTLCLNVLLSPLHVVQPKYIPDFIRYVGDTDHANCQLSERDIVALFVHRTNAQIYHLDNRPLHCFVLVHLFALSRLFR